MIVLRATALVARVQLSPASLVTDQTVSGPH
jgi:hypothetical protein